MQCMCGSCEKNEAVRALSISDRQTLAKHVRSSYRNVASPSARKKIIHLNKNCKKKY